MDTETLLPPQPFAPNTSASDSSRSLLTYADEYARQEPVKAVGTAAGLGFALTILPVGAIVGVLVALAWRLVKPALLILGFFKALDLLRVTSTPLRSKGN